MDFTKILRVGTVPVGASRASLFVKVKLLNNRLSFTGVIGPTPAGNARGGCGQIDMEFAHRNPKDNDSRFSKSLIKPKDIHFAKDWNASKWLDLLDDWKHWHLNDLQAGCEHQKDWTSKDIGKPCPKCGYKYGSAWKDWNRIPQAVLDRISALPDADKTPAWV